VRFKPGKNLAERSPLANTQKETIPNPVLNGYTKTRNHRKTLRKTQKNNNLLKPKE